MTSFCLSFLQWLKLKHINTNKAVLAIRNMVYKYTYILTGN